MKKFLILLICLLVFSCISSPDPDKIDNQNKNIVKVKSQVSQSAIIRKEKLEKYSIALESISETDKNQSVGDRFLLELSVPEEWALYDYLSDENRKTVKDYVYFSRKDTKYSVEVHFPEPGKYYFELGILAVDNASVGEPEFVLSYIINAEKVSDRFFKVSMNRYNLEKYGLSDFQNKLYHTNIKEPIPLGFKIKADTKTEFHIFKKNEIDILEQVEQKKINMKKSESDRIDYLFAPPESGLYYADIKIYVKYNENYDSLNLNYEINALEGYFPEKEKIIRGKIDKTSARKIQGQWTGAFISDDRGVRPKFIQFKIDKLIHEDLIKAIVYSRISPKELELALAGKLLPDEKYMYNRYVGEQEMKVILLDDHIELYPINWKPIWGNPANTIEMVGLTLYPDKQDTLKGKSFLAKPLSETLSSLKQSDSIDSHNLKVVIERNDRDSLTFYHNYLKRSNVLFDLKKGVTQSITTLDSNSIEYKIYIPSNFDPDNKAVIVINQAPYGFTSHPLAIKAAEKLGWISVGMPDFSNGKTKEGYLLSKPSGFYVIEDLLSRFQIAEKGLIFSGFSEGAKLTVERAMYYRGYTGGVIDIDMYYWRTIGLDTTVPVFGIVANGNKFFNDKYEKDVREALEKYRWGELKIFKGGHSWGPENLHEEALFWLAEVRKDPNFFKVP